MLRHIVLFQLVAGVDNQFLWTIAAQDGADKLLAERTCAAGDQYGGIIKHQSDIPVSKGLPTHASV